MTNELQFRVSAELKNILGRDLITSPDVAILELVKNSYDAHATKVEITFDDDYLCIADNGKGMSLDDLINKWLFVAYSAKSDGTEDQSYRSKIKQRHYAGAKGIGRMSCDRLARYLTLTTRSEGAKTEVLKIDWNIFEIDKQKEFDSIGIPHDTLDSIPSFPAEQHTGTILAFRGLRNVWGKDEILAIKKSLEKMINPFSGTDDDFQIEIIAPHFIDSDKDVESHSRVNGIIENSIADILKIKTTQIESVLKDGMIRTTLSDRGIKMYEIEEPNKFPELSSATISLFYLNRAAKYSFSQRMGIQPVQYGNVFLFRNGFRILPYGNSNDDSWGMNQRAQQGYNRFLSTRDLFGRVDVETDDVNAIKEVSSRDGGLIQTEASKQLMEYYKDIHKKLERYVSGVLWGEAFLRREYFNNKVIAVQERESLLKQDKDQNSAEHLYANIGSKVDFMQLIRSLVNEDSITILYYNNELADIVANPSDTEIIQSQMIEDARKVAEQTGDSYLIEKIRQFEQHMDELRRQKEEAERKAEEERIKAQKAQEKALEEQRKREEEEQRHKETQKNLNAQIQKNTYLQATQNTSKEVRDLIHVILISSNDAIGIISTAKNQLANNNTNDLRASLDEFEYHITKINKLSKLITKADLTLLAQSGLIDIQAYIKEYLANYENTFKVQYHSAITEPLEKKISILDLSIVLDNLKSNSEKAGATELWLDFSRKGRTYIVDFTDNGVGVDLNNYTPENIFEEGVTNRRGGSGIGLSTIRERMKENLNGNIEFLGNGLHFNTGATFRLTFE